MALIVVISDDIIFPKTRDVANSCGQIMPEFIQRTGTKCLDSDNRERAMNNNPPHLFPSCFPTTRFRLCASRIKANV